MHSKNFQTKVLKSNEWFPVTKLNIRELSLFRLGYITLHPFFPPISKNNPNTFNLVAFSSYFHTSFSPIYSPCGGL